MRLAVVRRLLVAWALLALLVGGSVTGAAGKGGTVTCKGAKVPVTVGKRTTCKPLAKALPEPRAIDPRLASLQQLLKFDPAKVVSGKKRKRARTLQSGFGAAGRRAQKKLLKVLPKALAFIDRKGGGARSSRLLAAPALASSGCQAGPAGPTGQTGGATVGLLGDNGGYIDAPAGGGLRVRVTFVSCRGANNYHLPDCPTANGSVDSSATGEFRATIEIWEGDRLVSRNSSVFEDRAKTHGEVGPDAKLKFIDVEHTQEVFIVASGGIVIRGGVTRNVRISMPGGKYDPAGASVRYFGDSISSDSGATGFASTAASALSAYQGAEPRWSTFSPPFCAEPVFAPDSETLKLQRGDNKQLAIYAKAKDGGRASAARWTLQSPENAEFSPTSSENPSPSIFYTVTNNPVGDKVKVTVKFTSTAGVGEKAWTQRIEGFDHISGTFTEREDDFGSTYEWEGKADFERSTDSLTGGHLYNMTSGDFTVTASGSAGALGRPSCSQSGSGHFPLSPADSGFIVLPRLGDTDPYLYTFTIQPAPEAKQNYTINFTCPDPKENNSDEFLAAFTITTLALQSSADGIDYSGSETEEEGTRTITRQWSFHAAE